MIIKNNQLSWLQFPRGQPVLDGTEENRLVEKKKKLRRVPTHKYATLQPHDTGGGK